MADHDRNESFETEIRSLVTAGHRIEAIKRYRERTGAGLKDAENAVEILARQQGISQRQSDSVEWDVVSLLEGGQKLQAIKFYCERTGSSLDEAKAAVDRIGKEHRIPTPGRAGCLGVLSLTFVLLLSIVIAMV